MGKPPRTEQTRDDQSCSGICCYALGDLDFSSDPSDSMSLCAFSSNMKKTHFHRSHSQTVKLIFVCSPVSNKMRGPWAEMLDIP